MNSLVETLNALGDQAPGVAWPMLWQSSLLIALMFAAERLLRCRVRASVRYALWLVVLAKLLLPPSLALPSGIGWWLRPAPAPPVAGPAPAVVSFGAQLERALPETPAFVSPAPARPRLTAAAGGLVISGLVSLVLLGWMLLRWRAVARETREAEAAPEEIAALAERVGRMAGLRRPARIRLVCRPTSPAVFGLVRPTVLLPRLLTEQLPPAQLQAVLLHELIHLKRRDAWVNCLQALLQMTYWWHPLLWLANARVRRLREEAVDDAVMQILKGDADTYAPALLEVARLAWRRPLSTLGLVGILESHSALHQRIKRLLDSRPPRKAGLTLGSAFWVAAFGALALPMGEGPARPAGTEPSAHNETGGWPDPHFAGYRTVKATVEYLLVEESVLRALAPALEGSGAPLTVASQDLTDLELKLKQAGATRHPPSGPVGFDQFSGGRFHWRLSGGTNNSVNFQTRTAGETTIVTGADIEIGVGRPELPGIGFTLVPWAEGNSLRCQVELASSADNNAPRKAEVTLRQDEGLLWNAPVGGSPPRRLVVMLKQHGPDDPEPLFIRIFQVESRALLDRLKGPRPLAQTNQYAAVRDVLQEAFAGVDLAPPKSFFFSEGNGLLLVRASKLDLAIIEARLRGLNVPSGVSNTPSPAAQTVAASTLVQEARRLYEISKLNDAEARLQKALEQDPQNQAAYYYLNLIEESRAKASRTRDRVLSPAPAPRTNLLTGDGGQAIDRKLDSTPSTNQPPPLYTRLIKVDAITFLNGLRSAAGLASTAELKGERLQKAMRDFFANLGVDLGAPKAIFFNDREGTLMLRATLQDLDIIESAVQVLNVPPPQINIKAKFIELSEESMPSFWAGLGLPPATGTNQSGSLTPPQSFAGILTPAQASAAFKRAQTTPGADLVNESSVTTLSGRQVQVQVVDLMTVVTNIDPRALTPPGMGASSTNGNGLYLTAEEMLGPTLDLMPQVARNGRAIQLTAIPTLTQFLGYDKPTNSVTVYVDGKKQKVTPPLPRFNVSSMTNTAVVWDGHTLVLGCLVSAKVARLKDKVPVLGDIPLVGALFRNESSSIQKKRVLVFITPTLIDPAGNRVHREGDLPAR